MLIFNPGTYTLNLHSGKYLFRLWGSRGNGDSTSISSGGWGGFVEGVVNLSKPFNVQINVGTFGTNGGQGSFYAGGGATDIRIGSFALEDRIIIAGGGGGACASYSGQYGGGGGIIPTAGYWAGYCGYPASQTAGGQYGGLPNGAWNYGSSGTLGIGGTYSGGGGLYGGGGGAQYNGTHSSGGGGGSSYVPGHYLCARHRSGIIFTSIKDVSNIRKDVGLCQIQALEGIRKSRIFIPTLSIQQSLGVR